MPRAQTKARGPVWHFRVRCAATTGVAVISLVVATGSAAAATIVGSASNSTFTSYPGLAARVIDASVLPFPVDGSTIAGAR